MSARGFAETETVDAEMRRAMCMLLTSRREGYGLVVVEAAARGTPSVVVAGEDNAATELIEEGVNGTSPPSADPQADRRGDRARPRGRPRAAREHRALVRRERRRLSLESSLQKVLDSYSADGASRPSARA